MTNVLIKYKVKDYPAWKVEFDAFREFRKSSGEKSYQIMHPASDTNDLVLLFEWDSETRARSFLKSPELKGTMAKAGVVGAPEIQFLQATQSGDT